MNTQRNKNNIATDRIKVTPKLKNLLKIEAAKSKCSIGEYVQMIFTDRR